MGSNSLREHPNNRMLLWRNAIQLFHIYPKLSFIGPFAEAGIQDYVIEVNLSYNWRKKDDPDAGKMFDPDICASGESGWLILELTTNTRSKAGKLEKYQHLDCNSLSIYDIPSAQGPPDVLSGRLEYVDDGGFCQLVLLDQFRVNKADQIQNARLRESLIAADGISLSKLPELPIAFVPESIYDMNGVRIGLIDLVLQIFAPNSTGKTAAEMADAGLERLARKVDPRKRNILINKIESEMGALAGDYLSDYLERTEDGRYAPKEKYVNTPNQRGAIWSRVRAWAFSEQMDLDYPFKSKDCSKDAGAPQ